MKKLAKIGLAVATLAGSAQFAMAQVSVGSQAVGRIPVLGDDLTTLVSRVINIVLIIAGILAVVYLVWGGITYITAGGDAEKAGKGRTAITNAIIGIIIIMASFAIYTAVIGNVGQDSQTQEQAGGQTF